MTNEPNDDLNVLLGEVPDQPTLEDMVGKEQTPSALPISSIRNRAATLSLLSSEPAKATETYQLLVKEGESGNQSLANQMEKNLVAQTNKLDLQGAMAILGDKGIPLAQKQDAINQLSASSFLKDSSTILQTNALAKASKGENIQNEDARLSFSEKIREIYVARNQVQAIVNAHGAQLPDKGIAALTADIAAVQVAPFGVSSSIGGVVNKFSEIQGQKSSAWEKVMSYLTPGSAAMSLKEKLANIPPSEQVQFAKDLTAAVQSSSGVIFGEDNHFAQMQIMRQIFEDGGYDNVDKFIDNVTPVLDAVGIGMIIRDFSKAGRGAVKASKAAQTPQPEVPSGMGPTGFGPARRPGSADPGTTDVPFEDITHKAEWEVVTEPPFYNPMQIPSGTKRLTNEAADADQVPRVEMNSTVRAENPASPAKIIQQANPEQARNLHEAVVSSGDDSVAEGLYGASKQDAIISDIVPQAATDTGSVTSKVNDIERNLRNKLAVPEQIIKAINNSGATFFSEQEKRIAQSNVHRNFTDVEGLVINDAMTSFKVDGGRIVVGATYGTSEGSFLRAEDAFEQARHALRGEGILDNEIIILEKQGLDHVPVDLESVRGKDGNYLVRVETEVEIFANTIGQLEYVDVKRNILDRVGMTVSKSQGSLSRWIFDPASMLHPRITGAATVTTDQTANFEKMMLDIASNFSDKFVKLNARDQSLVNTYIREANYQGIAFDVSNIRSRGISQAGADTLKSWRDFWDAHFYLENYDVIRSLSSNGYMKFDNANTTLFAKPISKNQNIIAIYDPKVDQVITLTSMELDDLYKNNGTLARLRRPTDFGGKTAEHMMVRNTPNEYLRKLRDTDQVLNYRDGYFQIQYTAPRFVEEIVRDKAGREIGRKVLAVAGDTREAESFARGLAKQSGRPSSDFNVRGDTRAMSNGDDAYWDLASAGGRIAQRHRGKRLEDASGLNHLGDGSYILNPVDSARRAAMSISGRTVTRPMLDAAKERFVQQYSKALPRNAYGEAMWPENVGQIGETGKGTSKLSADARTTFEYIRYLENGYINTIDEGFKAFMMAIADGLGGLSSKFDSKGLSLAERGATAVSGLAPAATAKGSVFTAYIASNFLRQWIVQPHQIIRTMAYNPIGWASGRIPKLVTQYASEVAGISTGAEGAAFRKFIDDSGLLASVDKSNLVKGTLMAAANTTNRFVRIVKKPFEVARIVGFDLGERVNLIGHAAAVYERKIREGVDMTNKALRDEAYSQIRGISGEMNFAGDMPANQNSFSALVQFMVVPQKMLLQASNRKISKADSMRIFAGDMFFWGTPIALIGTVIGQDVLPENDDLRKVLTDGVEAWAYDRAFTELSGERTSIDISSLSPYEFGGWKEFTKAMLTGGTLGVITNSPAGQLYLKEGGKVRGAVSEIGRYFSPFADVTQDKPEFLDMLSKVGEISSGWSNFAKAKLLLETRKRMDQYGNVTDEEVSKYEAFAQVLGFGTTDTRMLYEISKSVGEDTKEYKDSVLAAYKDIKREYYNHFHQEIGSTEMIIAITGWALKAYGDSPVALKIIQDQLKMDLQGKDEALLGQIIKALQIPDITNMRDRIKLAPLEEEKKQQLYQMIDELEKTRLENKTDKE